MRNKSQYEEIEPSFAQKRSAKLFKYVSSGIVLTCVLVGTILAATSTGRSKPILLAGEEAPGNDPDLVVELDKGSVRGFKLTSRDGREFLAFRGIPYAKPPVGKLRFEPTEDGDPWEGVLNATEFGPECLQVSKGNLKGSEDCLHLNVYTPKAFNDLQRRPKFPVLVYIHGGGPSGDSRRNTGEYFMDEDVVLVGMNYRMGIFGNLNTNDSEARGNQGLRDQIKALEWIKANIAKFGGDRRRVTLFGNSYGSMGIATHLLSPMTKGLFHQFICQSGHAIFPDHILLSPFRYAAKLGELMNCTDTSNSKTLVECLRSADGGVLAVQARKVNRENGNLMSASTNVFTTTVDPQLDGVNEDDVYLPELPLDLLRSGQTKGMPAMIGVNRAEGLAQSVLILLTPQLTQAFNENWEEQARVSLSLPSTNTTRVFVNSARDFYFGGEPINESLRDNLTNLYSDRLGMHPAHVSAEFQLQSNRRGQEVYLYYFSHEVVSSYLDPNIFGIDEAERKEMGPAHADELQFLFPYPPFPLIPADSPNANFSRMMVHLWATFAADGKPTLDKKSDPSWLPIQEKPYGWFQLDEVPQMVNILDDRMAFWDKYNLSDLYVSASTVELYN